MTKKVRTFIKAINGQDVTASAYSEADAVQFTYDGWRDITDDLTKGAAAAEAAAPAKKTAGKAAAS
jgi:hypothetical protein